jgi:glycosyltransferase involved in cell wall biosynthesis
MTDVVFYAGRHRIDGGATRSVADCVLRHAGDFRVALIGMGLADSWVRDDIERHDLEADFRRYSLPVRAVQRVLRSQALGARGIALCNFLDTRLDVVADLLCRRKLVALLERGDQPTVFLSWNSMSLASGRFARSRGLVYAIHSQWSHPHTQRAALEAAHRQLGISAAPLSKARLHRQLAEFEIADIVWCASSRVAESLLAGGVSEKKLMEVPLGVDRERFVPPTPTRSPEARFAIVMVGSLILTKGVHLLLEAVLRSGISDAAVILNGQHNAITRPLIEDYARRLAGRGIEVVAAPGDPRANLQRASVFALPSLDEAFGLSVLEAMATGLPVVISSNVGARDCVEHGGNGFVFECGDVDALAAHLTAFYGDRQRCRAFGRRSLELVERYDVRSISRELMEALLTRAAELRSSPM